MTKLFDPLTDEKLELFGSKKGSDEIYNVSVDAVIRNISYYYQCSELEAIRMLQNSDIDNPVEYKDEQFWVE